VRAKREPGRRYPDPSWLGLVAVRAPAWGDLDRPSHPSTVADEVFVRVRARGWE
jgi:hypothetical protein